MDRNPDNNLHEAGPPGQNTDTGSPVTCITIESDDLCSSDDLTRCSVQGKKFTVTDTVKQKLKMMFTKNQLETDSDATDNIDVGRDISKDAMLSMKLVQIQTASETDVTVIDDVGQNHSKDWDPELDSDFEDIDIDRVFDTSAPAGEPMEDVDMTTDNNVDERQVKSENPVLVASLGIVENDKNDINKSGIEHVEERQNRIPNLEMDCDVKTETNETGVSSIAEYDKSDINKLGKEYVEGWMVYDNNGDNNDDVLSEENRGKRQLRKRTLSVMYDDCLDEKIQGNHKVRKRNSRSVFEPSENDDEDDSDNVDDCKADNTGTAADNDTIKHIDDCKADNTDTAADNDTIKHIDDCKDDNTHNVDDKDNIKRVDDYRDDNIDSVNDRDKIKCVDEYTNDNTDSVDDNNTGSVDDNDKVKCVDDYKDDNSDSVDDNNTGSVDDNDKVKCVDVYKDDNSDSVDDNNTGSVDDNDKIKCVDDYKDDNSVCANGNLVSAEKQDTGKYHLRKWKTAQVSYIEDEEDEFQPSDDNTSIDEGDSDNTPAVSKQKPYTCTAPGCDKGYQYDRGLQRHMQAAHPDFKVNAIKETFTCIVAGCHAEFKNLVGRNKHFRTYHPDFKTTTRTTRSLEIKTTSNCLEKKYTCFVRGCGNSFQDTSSRQKHVIDVHAGFVSKLIKPNDGWFLAETRHVKSGDIPFLWRYNKGLLERFERRKSDSGDGIVYQNKPYTCQAQGCKKRFCLATDLKSHKICKHDSKKGLKEQKKAIDSNEVLEKEDNMSNSIEKDPESSPNELEMTEKVKDELDIGPENEIIDDRQENTENGHKELELSENIKRVSGSSSSKIVEMSDETGSDTCLKETEYESDHKRDESSKEMTENRKSETDTDSKEHKRDNIPKEMTEDGKSETDTEPKEHKRDNIPKEMTEDGKSETEPKAVETDDDGANVSENKRDNKEMPEDGKSETDTEPKAVETDDDVANVSENKRDSKKMTEDGKSEIDTEPKAVETDDDKGSDDAPMEIETTEDKTHEIDTDNMTDTGTDLENDQEDQANDEGDTELDVKKWSQVETWNYVNVTVSVVYHGLEIRASFHCSLTSIKDAAELKESIQAMSLNDHQKKEKDKPVPSDFQVGQFLIEKTDLHNEDTFAIWKIMSSVLLQKYEMVSQDGIIYHTPLKTFCGYNDLNKNYILIKVQQGHVRGQRDLIEVCEVNRPKRQIQKDLAAEYDNNPLLRHFTTYTKVLLRQVFDPQFLANAMKNKDDDIIGPIHEIDKAVKQALGQMDKVVHWTKKLKEVLKQVPQLREVLKPEPELTCEGVEKSTETVSELAFLYGYPYNHTTLELDTSDHLFTQEFKIGMTAMKHIGAYHRLCHFRFHQYERCKAKMKIVHGDIDKGVTGVDVDDAVDQCLRKRMWLLRTFEDFIKLINPP